MINPNLYRRVEDKLPTAPLFSIYISEYIDYAHEPVFFTLTKPISNLRFFTGPSPKVKIKIEAGFFFRFQNIWKKTVIYKSVRNCRTRIELKGERNNFAK